ncbi:MAG: hypothetical protein WKG00_15530 [Polyangiaceae bacterium]
MGRRGARRARAVRCGSTVGPNDNQGAGGAGGSATSSATGDPSSSGSGGACAAFADETGSGPVTIRVVNGTPLDIYVPATCSQGDMTIVGADQQVWSDKVSCAMTCEALQTHPLAQCDACAVNAILVPAGGVRELSWSGTDMTIADMPAECWFEPGNADLGCVRILAAPAQKYQAVVAGYNQCDGREAGPCECTEGVCFGTAGGALATPIPAFFEYPSGHQVDVVFDACAFGCPDGDDDGTAPPGG